MQNVRILIVESDDTLRLRLEDLLVQYFTNVVTANSYSKAILAIKECDFDVIISGYQLENESGLQLRNWQIENKSNAEFILITGYSGDFKILNQLKKDYIHVLQKPAQPTELIGTLRKLFPRSVAA